uniref:Uncharacterized protein n=1 Tax=Rhizophora mucronata TaxID=61149 RepID=A0A2P2P9K8_RHIMU
MEIFVVIYCSEYMYTSVHLCICIQLVQTLHISLLIFPLLTI